MKKLILLLSSSLILLSCESKKTETEQNTTVSDSTTTAAEPDSVNKSLYILTANATAQAPKIDGDSADNAWKNQTWYPINHLWLGKEYTKEDFDGKFKLSWDANKLYLLVEVTDDSLIDIHQKWDSSWWNDDCVEIFIDEDKGGDLHQFNHKAFAYHVALNCKDVVDLGPDQKPHLYNNHIKAAKKTKGKTTVWEFAIDVYNDTYVDGKDNKPVKLQKDKKLGFCLNYCDNDKSAERENFISSIPVVGEDKDQGWKDASVFNELTLK